MLADVKRARDAGLNAQANEEAYGEASRPSKRAAHDESDPTKPQGSSAGTRASSSSSQEEQLVRCFVRKEGYVTYHPVKKPHCVHFGKFVERDSRTSGSESEVVGFFRGLLADLAAKGVSDFHLQIVGSSTSGPGGFFVEVRFGELHEGPPHVPPEHCIACQPDAEIFPGMKSQETYLGEYDSLHSRVSLDAQGRPAFICTPLRHVGSLAELEDTEVADLFRTASALMKREKLHFLRMVLNHGSYRNLPHLHLKILVEQKLFDSARKRWNPARTAAFEKLLALRPAKTSSVCKFFKGTGYCRYGDKCRNLHSTE